MPSHRRTNRRRILLAVLAVLLPVLAYATVRELRGPMKEHHSQCLVCGRTRIEKWICGEKRRDDIFSNDYAQWVDSFTPSDHPHVWMIATAYDRHEWFEPKSVGCGGIAVIPQIFRQRESLGEQSARRLMAKWHALIEGQGLHPTSSFPEILEFEARVSSDPRSLLDTD